MSYSTQARRSLASPDRFRHAAASGAIAATLSAASPLWSLKTPAAAVALGRSLFPQKITVYGTVLTTITTAVPFDLELVIARGFTVADTGGSGVAPATLMNMIRTGMADSMLAGVGGDIRIASTATLTAGTRTLDTTGIGRVSGGTGTVAGTSIFGANGAVLYDADGQGGATLNVSEGLVIRAPLAGPATGTFQIVVAIDWTEIRA